MIDQRTVANFLPPSENVHVWRGLTRGEWCGHLPPYRRIRATWSEFGEEWAMVNVLCRLWQQYCEANALDFDVVCPYKELLRPTAVPASNVAAGAAASSSSGPA